MKRLSRSLSAALVAAFLAPPGAIAGIDLTWDGCSDGAGVRTTTFDCVAGGTRELIGTFRLPSAVPDFIGIQGTIAIAIEGSFDLSPFWQYEKGGCNAPHLGLGSFRIPANGCSAGSSPWETEGGLPFFEFTRSASQARLEFAAVHVPARTTALTADFPYFALCLQFDLSGASSCGGCSTPAAFYLQEFAVASLTGPALYLNKEGSQATCAIVNGASDALCEAVPVRNRTWGAIKTLYR